MDFLQKKQEKLQKKEAEEAVKKREEIGRYSFKPKINKSQKKKSKKKRTIKDLYKWQQEKLNKRFQETLKKDATPSKKNINKNSEKILEKSNKKRNSIKIEDRLLILEKRRQARLRDQREKDLEEKINPSSKKKGQTSIRKKKSFRKTLKSKGNSVTNLPLQISKKLNVGFYESGKKSNRKKKKNSVKSSLGKKAGAGRRSKKRGSRTMGKADFKNLEIEIEEFKTMEDHTRAKSKEEDVRDSQKLQIFNLDCIISQKLSSQKQKLGEKKRRKKSSMSRNGSLGSCLEFKKKDKQELDLNEDDLILRLQKISRDLLNAAKEEDSVN